MMFFKDFLQKNTADFCRLFLALSLVSTIQCADEHSAEDKKRDDERRQAERLKKAEGSYQGWAQRSDTAHVPVAVTIDMLQNPQNGNDQPQLSVKLKLGFLSGVTLTSSSTSFDWKTGELNAKFSDSKATQQDGSSLELRAFLKDNELKDAALVGATTGKTPLILSSTKDLTLTEKSKTYNFELRSRDQVQSEPFANFAIKTVPTMQRAPRRSDLPALPGLEVSFAFTAVNHTESSSEVYYDPLEGTLEINNHNYSRFLFRSIFITAIDRTHQESLTIEGEAFVGANKVADLVAEPSSLKIQPPSTPLGRSYFGTYTPPSQNRNFKVVAYLDSLGGIGTNSGELAFATFPTLRLRLLICSGTATQQQRNSELNQIDYINYAAKFISRNNQDQFIYDLNFDRGWQRLTGKVTRSLSTSTGVPGATGYIDLEYSSQPLNRGCAEFGAIRE